MLTGALNADTALRWASEGQQWINKASNSCVIDLAQVDSIDSAGIAILLSWERYAKHQRKSLSFKNPPEKLLAMLQLYDLTEILHVVIPAVVSGNLSE